MYRGISVIAAKSNEIPVAPPSIKSFVNRKPLKPKEAEKIPSMISIKFLKLRFKEIIDCRYSFATLYSEGFSFRSFLLFLNLRVVRIIIFSLKGNTQFSMKYFFHKSKTEDLFV
jgi:hypothetical protein